MSKPCLSDIAESKNPIIRALVATIKQALYSVNHLGIKGPNLIMRTVAYSTWEYRRKQFMKAHKVKSLSLLLVEDKSLRAIPSILDQSVWNEKIDQGRDRVGCMDHVDVWFKNKKPYLMTSQPYCVSKSDLRDLIAHCDKYDIDFQIDAESFYFPGHTIRILFKKGYVSPYDAIAHEDQSI